MTQHSGKYTMSDELSHRVYAALDSKNTFVMTYPGTLDTTSNVKLTVSPSFIHWRFHSIMVVPPGPFSLTKSGG